MVAVVAVDFLDLVTYAWLGVFSKRFSLSLDLLVLLVSCGVTNVVQL